jgi:hypothetical protein
LANPVHGADAASRRKMKKNVLPDSQQKRKLLFDKKIPRERIIFYGDMFLREGRVAEAAELFFKVSHKEGLEGLKALAIEQGDSFLYGVVCRGSAVGSSKQEWVKLGKKAMELEKYAHAVRAFRRADDAELQMMAEKALKEVVSLDKA